MFSQDNSRMKAYGKYEISINNTALEIEALNRTVSYFKSIEVSG